MMTQQRTSSSQRITDPHGEVAAARIVVCTVVCIIAIGALAGCGSVTTVEPDAPVADAPIADAPGEPDAMPCTQGDSQVEDPASGHCYMLFLSAADWPAAGGLCATVSADTHLVTITSQAEHDIVRPLIGTRDVWIGASDVAQPGTWAWVSGERFDYTNWDGGQPDNATEHCVRADGGNGARWHDDGCGDRWTFICERP